MYIPHIGWFVAAEAAHITTVEGAIVMPVGVSPKDANDVTEYLLSVGLTNFELANRPNRRTTTNLVEVGGELVEVTTTRRIADEWCRS
jgi:hypothetical protein